MRTKSKLVIILLVVAFCMCALSACFLGTEDTVTVTFFAGNDSTEVEPITVTAGDSIEKPQDPVREHYTLVGWETNAGILVQFPYTPDLDVTLYAKWQRAEYTIVFDLNGGTYSGSNGVLNQTITSGNDATLPDNPRKTGYSFVGWDPEPNLTDIRANATYTAQWEVATQKLEFIKISGEEAYEVKCDPENAVQAIVIPSTYEGLPVTKIADYAFNGRTQITSITISEGITTIGERAFMNCDGLTTITIPSSVTSIGSSAFSNCAALTSITIPAGVTIISSSTFYSCIALSSVTILGEVTSIEQAAFGGCIKLTEITIPSSVTSIGNSAFKGCTKLDDITIEDGVQTIGMSAFEGCTALQEILIPDSVTGIGLSAFKGCSKLAKITVPFVGSSATGNQYFGHIFGATQYQHNNQTVPQSLTMVIVGGTSIADNAFYQCSYLTGIEIGDEIITIGDNAFYQCSSLRLVTIGNNVEKIGKNAFQYCFALDRVTFDNKQGWYISSNGTNVFDTISVQNDDDNAVYLEETYVGYYWLRNK